MQLLLCNFTGRSFFMAVMLMCFAFTSTSSAQRAKAHSQRNSSTIRLDSQEITTVDIFLEQEIELKVRTHDIPEIWFNESQGGEYKSAVVFNTEFVGKKIVISDMISPEFHFPQDKLSAHKIIDSTAEITIPSGMKVNLHVTSSFLTISGDFKNLLVNQQSGDCAIRDTTGDFKVVSVYANIHLNVNEYLIALDSKEGLLKELPLPETYRYQAQIETIYGNVSVKD